MDDFCSGHTYAISKTSSAMFKAQVDSLNLTAEQKAAYLASTQKAMKAMSPVAGVDGESAKRIVAEMASGKKLIYRQVMIAANGQLGEVAWTDSSRRSQLVTASLVFRRRTQAAALAAKQHWP